MRWRVLMLWALTASLAGCLLLAGCSIGPRTLHATRLPYNEAVKVTTEEQMLLNIVRLRYSDNPSSLAVTSIAAQFELVKKLQLVPFFTSTGDAVPRSFSTVLPGAECDTADRPTLSLTPQDEIEFTRRLFTPLTLDGIVYLAKTTWPISTVFRLYLENLNWVSNGQNVSGPTPLESPEFEEFLRGISALRRLQMNNKMAILPEERDERVGGMIPGSQISPRDLIEAAKANHELKPDADVDTGETKKGKEEKSEEKEKEISSPYLIRADQKNSKPETLGMPRIEEEKNSSAKTPKKNGGSQTLWSLTKKKEAPFLYIAPDAKSSADWLEFCRVFRIKPGEKKYEIEVTKLTPFPAEYPAEGVKVLDLETRSLLQVLYFVAHGIEIPPEHQAAGLVRLTLNPDGSVFDYNRLLGGLFKVFAVKCKKRPECAAVAVHYLDHWYYIDATDHDTRATFALLLQMSHLELGTKTGGAPVLTLPIGGR